MNTKLVRLLLHHRSTLIAIIFVVMFAWIQSLLTNDVLIKGNYGMTNFMIRQVLDGTVLVLIFGLIKMVSYKYMFFGDSGGGAKTGFIGSFISLIVTGCPSCSLTLASYLGLSAFITWLPYDGIELKVLSVLLMGYAIYDVWKNLEVCEIKKPNKVKK